MPAARCPMCHHANEGTAWQCVKCGYEFGQSRDKLREMLLEQLGRARIHLWIFVLFSLVVTAVVGYLIARGIIGFVVGTTIIPFIWWTVRSAQKISISKHSLALIEEPELPKATARSSK
jgi:hypothetical protein